MPPLRILESCFVRGTKVLVHRVQVALSNGDVSIQWMSNEDLNQWRLRLFGYVIHDGTANHYPR